MRKKSARIITIGFLTAGLMIGVHGIFFAGDVYNSAKSWLQLEARHGNFVREIGTNKDLWLNGYLGIFFRFKMFGILNWLAIPLLIYFLVTIGKRKRWEIALALALILSCIFISIQGYMNFRYQLTLFPALITIIFLFGWKVLGEQDRKVVITVLSIGSCLLFVGSYLLLMNFFSLRNDYAHYLKGSIVDRLTVDRFPYKLFEYIDNNVADDSVILERNVLILYYYTSKNMRRIKGKNKYILARGDAISGAVLVCEDKGYKLYQVKK